MCSMLRVVISKLLSHRRFFLSPSRESLCYKQVSVCCLKVRGTSIQYEAIPAVAFMAQEGEKKWIPVVVRDEYDILNIIKESSCSGLR